MRPFAPWPSIFLLALACAAPAPRRAADGRVDPAESASDARVPAGAAAAEVEPAVEPIAYSLADCVRIEASDPRDGAAEEERWLVERYPGHRRLRGYLAVNENASGRSLDLLVVADADGARHEVCFDITRFYGQFRPSP